MTKWIVVVAVSVAVWFAPTTGHAVDPSGYGQAGGEFDIKIPRVPAGELADAKAL